MPHIYFSKSTTSSVKRETAFFELDVHKDFNSIYAIKRAVDNLAQFFIENYFFVKSDDYSVTMKLKLLMMIIIRIFLILKIWYCLHLLEYFWKVNYGNWIYSVLKILEKMAHIWSFIEYAHFGMPSMKFHGSEFRYIM